jgi:hypothetical protein
MAKDGIDAMETGDWGIAPREFRSKHSAGNEAVARIRGGPCVAKLLST